MKNPVRRLVSIAALALGVTGTAMAEWTKTYVIEWYEPAMYYGAKTGVIDPGTDCPAGSNAEPHWIKIMMEAGYSREEAEWLRNPANPTRSPVHGQNQMAFRGKDRANVYINPTSTPDPGLTPVTGKIAEGLNLDGDKTNGFTSPDGEKGIDNKFYYALGCWKTYRGPPRLSSGSLTFNDSMREGSWTIAIVVSGKGTDPMNDSDVEVGFYNSSDKLVKDGNGNIARGYTFSIQPDQKLEAILKAKTVNGVIVSAEPTEEIWLRDPSYNRQLQLLKAQVKLTMKDDGALVGYLAGYRPWEVVYNGWVNARGPVIEALTWVQLPGVYYSLRRNADYSPTGPGGDKTHISFAMRIEAVPAYIVTPDASQQVASVESYKAIAPTPPAPRAGGFRIIDGLVPDRNGNLNSGPDYVVLPSSAKAGGSK